MRNAFGTMATYNSSTVHPVTPTTLGSDKKTDSIDKEALGLGVSIVLSVFVVFAVVGNSLVCFVFYKQPQLRRVVYYPVISLAIADLLCGTLAMPAYIAKKHVHGGWWEGLTCDVFRFTYFFTEYASVLSLTVVSAERFCSVYKPVFHRTWLTSKKMIAFLAMSWLDAAVVSVLPFVWRRGTEDEPCVYDPTREWSLMVIVANVIFPFLIMLCCHICTVSYALRYSRKRNTHLLEKTGNPQYDRQTATEQKNKSYSKRERDITRSLGLVVGAFVLCWGPSTFYYFIRMVCPQCFRPSFDEVKPIFNAVVKLMTFANSCVNPLIYYWMNRTLRDAFYDSVLGKAAARRRKRERDSVETRECSIASIVHRPQTKTRCLNTNPLMDTNGSDERRLKVQTRL